jgi:hypothetical protein
VKRSLAKVEGINERASNTLFLTPYSQSPMKDAGKVTILNDTGPGLLPQEPLALVAKVSDSERAALESRERNVLASSVPAESGTSSQNVQYRTPFYTSTLCCVVTFGPFQSLLPDLCR